MKLFNIFDSSQFSVLFVNHNFLIKNIKDMCFSGNDKLFSFKSIDMLSVFMTLRNRITNKHKQQTKAAAARTCRPATYRHRCFLRIFRYTHFAEQLRAAASDITIMSLTIYFNHDYRTIMFSIDMF